MNDVLNVLIGLVIGLNLLMLGTSLLPSLIRLVAVQGIILGVMPLLTGAAADRMIYLVVAVTIGAKGVVIPGLLRRAMRDARIDRDLRPLIGLIPSLFLGAAGTVGAVILAGYLPLASGGSALLVSGALASLLSGLLLMIGRSKAISQVCGYLILENGIYLFGLLLIKTTPLLVEGGILLDLVVGVFIIGIIVDRIQKTFDSLDTRHLTSLKE